jgi:hypothetical protein
MMIAKVDDFAALLSKSEATETELAVAFLWFATHQEDNAHEVSAKILADLIVSHRLRSSVNASRLSVNLGKHPDVVRGKSQGSFRIKASSDEKLSNKYKSHARIEPIKIRDDLIPNSINFGEKKIFDCLRREANGAYDQGLYNASAVMCRRLMETLLIEAFDAQGKIADILDGKEIKQLSDILGTVKSGNSLRISRSSRPILERVKQVGDTAAHGRYYLSTKKDLDELNPTFRHLLTELAALAKL